MSNPALDYLQSRQGGNSPSNSGAAPSNAPSGNPALDYLNTRITSWPKVSAEPTTTVVPNTPPAQPNLLEQAGNAIGNIFGEMQRQDQSKQQNSASIFDFVTQLSNGLKLLLVPPSTSTTVLPLSKLTNLGRVNPASLKEQMPEADVSGTQTPAYKAANMNVGMIDQTLNNVGSFLDEHPIALADLAKVQQAVEDTPFVGINREDFVPVDLYGHKVSINDFNRGVVEGVGNLFFGSSQKVQDTFNKRLIQPTTFGGRVMQTVGSITGSALGYMAGGSILKVAGFGAATLPALFAALGQTSDDANTTIQQRIEQMPVDVIAGFMFNAAVPETKTLGVELLKAAGKSSAIMSGQTFLTSLIKGMSPEDAAKTAATAAAIGGLFYIGGTASGLLTDEVFKGVTVSKTETFSPDDLRSFVNDSGLVNTKAGQALNELATRGEAIGKDIQISVEGLRKSQLAKVFNIDTPEGLRKFGVDFVSPAPKLPGPIAPAPSGEKVSGPVQPGEYTPQDIRSLVIGTPLENTPDGKALLKSSLTAEQAGQNIKLTTETPQQTAVTAPESSQTRVPPEVVGTKVVDQAGAPQLVYRGVNADRLVMANPAYENGVTFFSNDQATAQDYANAEGDQKIKDLVKKVNFLKQSYGDKANQGYNSYLNEIAGKIKEVNAQIKARQQEISRNPSAKIISGKGTVQAAYLKMDNPLRVDAGGLTFDKVTKAAVEQARANGNDGVIIKNVIDAVNYQNARPITTYLVFSKNQIFEQLPEQTAKEPVKRQVEASTLVTAPEQPKNAPITPSEMMRTAAEAYLTGEPGAAEAIIAASEGTEKLTMDQVQAYANQLQAEQTAELEKEKSELLKDMTKSDNPDDPTTRMLAIADELAPYIKAHPGMIKKLAGSKDIVSAMDKLVNATDIEGFKKFMDSLANILDGEFNVINQAIISGGIDGANYDQFKARLATNLVPRAYSKRSRGAVKTGAPAGQPEVTKGGNQVPATPTVPVTPTVPEAPVAPEKSVTLTAVPIPGLDKFFEQDVVPGVANAKTGTAKTFDTIKKIFAPATRGPEAQLSASILREDLGVMVRDREIAYSKMKDARKQFDRYSKEQSLDFIDKVETGQTVPGAEKFIKVFRDALNLHWSIIQEIKGGDAYIENYFPHIWKDPAKAAETLAKYFGKRPLEGSKGYMKQRKIPTVKEGIALGLELVSYNPVDLIAARISDMDRFIMAHNLMEDFKENGLREFVRVGQKPPTGWGKVDDSTTSAFYKPTVKEYYDQIVMGTLEDVAKSFGITHERVAALGGNKMGVSYTGENLVKTRFATPEAALLHELGHQLDPKFDIQTKFAFGKESGEFRTTLTGRQAETKESIAHRQKMKAEMRALADTKWENQAATDYFKSYVRKGEEKVAAIFEAYLQAPEKFKAVAPDVYDEFVKFLKSDPKLKPILDIEPSMAFTSREQDLNVLAKAGDWYMPEQAATIVNNYLSPGLAGNPLYDSFRMLGNSMNQVQLGISAFHATFTTIDASVSRTALGIQQVFNGKPGTGLKNIITSPVAAVTNVFQGNKLLKDYYRDNPEIPELVLALEKAGGRVKMDSFYGNNAVTNFMKALRSGNYPGAVLRTPGALIEALSRPILEEFVPRQKLGVFSDLAKDILDSAKKGNWDERLTTLRLQEAWDSVDNRMGQMVYDNLFWHKTLKDLALVLVRSVGWNLGTIREGIGGLTEYAELPFKLAGRIAGGKKTGGGAGGPGATGETIRMTPKMAYTLAYPIVLGILGAVLGYLYTGKGPKKLLDLYYIPTGKIKPDGTEERVSLPSYMKDVFAYGIEPVKTIENKLTPALSAIADMLNNQDFYNTEIRNANDSLVQQIGDEFKYLADQFQPFTFQAIQKNIERGEGVGSMVQSFFGIQPAPGYVTQTPLQREISTLYSLRNQGVKTQESTALSNAKTAIRQAYLKGDIAGANALMAKLGLTKAAATDLVKSADIPSDVRLFGMLPATDQLDLLKKMNMDDLQRYSWSATKEVKAQFQTINATTKNFADLVNSGQIKAPVWKKNININQ
jgi:hypothetical protein